MSPFALLLILVGVLTGAIGSLFLKIGAGSLGTTKDISSLLWGVATSWQIVTGVGLFVVPSLLWIHLLRTYDLSKVQPLLALTYVVTPLLAAVFLSENVSSMRWLGIIIIVCGVAVVARS